MRTSNRPILVVAMLAIAACAGAQDASPGVVTWQWTVQRAPDPGVYELAFSARIMDGYIVYASDFSLDIGPRPTRLKLDDSGSVSARGALQSVGALSRKDKAFNGEYRYFEGSAQLRQTVAVQPGVTRVSGVLSGQICHEADGTCTLFRQPFQATLR